MTEVLPDFDEECTNCGHTYEIHDPDEGCGAPMCFCMNFNETPDDEEDEEPA